MGKLVAFPNMVRPARPWPTEVRYAVDFNRPCVELLSGGRVLSRRAAVSEAEARHEVARLVGTGLRLMADAPIAPTSFGDDDGGDSA